jgi:hypothetical protein
MTIDELNDGPEILYKDGEEDPSIIEAMSGLRSRAKVWEEVQSAGIAVDRDETQVTVSGNTYPVRNALKRNGFRWNPQARNWYFVTKEYYNIVMRQGRVYDGKIRYHQEPLNWIEDVHAELFG